MPSSSFRRATVAGAVSVTALGLAAVPAQATGTFHPYVADNPGAEVVGTAIGDVTGDGRPDLLFTTGYGGTSGPAYRLFVRAQQPDGSLGAATSLATSGAYSSRMTVVVADLDGDGDQDAAVGTTAGVDVFEQSAGALAFTWTVPTGDTGDVEATDVSGDGLADLVVGTRAGVQDWWQVNGDFMPSPRGRYLTPTTPTELEVGDVSGDGLADVVSVSGTALSVRLQQSDHSFAASVDYSSGGTSPWSYLNGLALGDLDHDGRADVVATMGGNRPNAFIVTRLQRPDGTLGAPVVRPTYDIPEAVEVADVDRNGLQDVVVLHGGWNDAGVYGQTATGDLYAETLFPIPYASHYPVKGLAVGDLSGDGSADLAIADYNNGTVLLRGSVPGTDLAAPETSITTAPTGTIRTRTASVSFAATESSTFECSLDGAGFGPCTSPWTLTNLSAGSHTVRVRATDRAGNTDTSPATSSFTVDGPDTTITGGPTGTVRSTTAQFSFTATPAPASFECALDTVGFAPCSSGQTWTGLPPGSTHTLVVRAVNGEGLADSTPASRTFTVAPASDLVLTLTPSTGAAKRGQQVLWTLKVGSNGPQLAADVVAVLGLPAGLTLGTVPPGCTVSGSTVRCALQQLSPTAIQQWTVPTTVTATKGTLTATGVLSTSTWDPASSNDTSSASVKVGAGK